MVKLTYERRLCGLMRNVGPRVCSSNLVYKHINTRLTKRVARLTRKHVQEAETRRWTESATREPTMTTNAASKVVIMGGQIYDNSGSSGLLFEAHTGPLKTRV